MSQIFPLVARRRKYMFVVKVVFLIMLSVGLVHGYIGNYLPAEFWQVVMVFLSASIVLNLIRFFTVSTYRKRSRLPVGHRDNFVAGIDALSALVTFVITGASIFFIFHIPFQSFLTSISLVAVALVLIFRDYISNYLDSFRLMFSADYRIGDYIKVSEFTKGIIMDVSFRATKLKTDEGDVLFIPNTKLMTSEVVNFSKTKFKRIIVPFSMSMISSETAQKFEDDLKAELLQQFPDLINPEKIFLRVLNIHNWQTNFSFEVSVDHYSFEIEDQIAKAVYLFVLSKQKYYSAPDTVFVQSNN